MASPRPLGDRLVEVDHVHLREIRGEPQEMADLQRALEGAPTYSRRITGAPAGPADAQSTLTMLPPDKTREDKFVFGIYAGDACIGCIDLIRGWPNPETAMLGLLLITEPYQHRGVGRLAYALLEERIKAWGTCTRVRIGVVETNRAVLPFWQGLGFAPTGQVRPYRYADVSSTIVVLERVIAAGACATSGRA